MRRRLALTVAASLALSPFLTSCSGFFIKPTISSVYVTPAAATLGIGQNTPLSAYATYSDGTQNQLSGDSVELTSSDPTIATVTSPGGSVTGVAIGSSTITATAQGVSGTATVTVTLANITSLVITTTPCSTAQEANHVRPSPERPCDLAEALRSPPMAVPTTTWTQAVTFLTFVEHPGCDHQHRPRQWQRPGNQCGRGHHQ